MNDYLSEKYKIYSKDSTQKPFTFEHIQDELLCSSVMAKMHIKETLNRAYENLNFEQFSKVIVVALDLE